MVTKDALLQDWQAVNVRDISLLHVQTLLAPEARNDRFLGVSTAISVKHMRKSNLFIDSGNAPNLYVLDEVISNSPVDKIVVLSFKLEDLETWQPKINFSTNKSQRILGTQYRGIDDTVHGTLVDVLEHGWKQ